MTMRRLKVSLLMLAASYLAWCITVHVLNFLRSQPQYRLVPLATNPDLYQKARATDGAWADRELVVQRLDDKSSERLPAEDERAIKWITTKRHLFFPRIITQLTIRKRGEVEVHIQKVPWGKERWFLAGRDTRGWFPFYSTHDSP